MEHMMCSLFWRSWASALLPAPLADHALPAPSNRFQHKMDPQQPQQQAGYPSGGTASAPGGTDQGTNPGGQQQPQSGAAPAAQQKQQQQQAMATTQQQKAQLEQAQRQVQAQMNAAGTGAGVGNTGATTTAAGTAGAAVSPPTLPQQNVSVGAAAAPATAPALDPAAAATGASTNTTAVQPPVAAAPAPAPAAAPAPTAAAPAPAASNSSAAASQQRKILSANAKQALTKAVLSSLHHPHGKVDPTLMAEARMATGLTEETILNAAKVAREREMKKRMERQQAERAKEEADAAEREKQKRLAEQRMQKYVELQNQKKNQALVRQKQEAAKAAAAKASSAYAQSYQQYQQKYGTGTAAAPASAMASGALAAYGAATTTGGGAAAQQQSAANIAAAKKAAEAAAEAKRLKAEQQAKMAAEAEAARLKAQKEKEEREAEEARWMRIQSGLFVMERETPGYSSNGKPLVKKFEPKYVGPTVRSTDIGPADANKRDTKENDDDDNGDDEAEAVGAAPGGNEVTSEEDDSWKTEALKIQRALRMRMMTESAAMGGHTTAGQKATESKADQTTVGKKPSSRSKVKCVTPEPRVFTAEAVQGLLDPDVYRRLRLEPRKEAKALDRNLRKARQTTAENLVKKHRELHKALSSHQTEFFRYHRARRQTISRVARGVRDRLEGEEKQKEKDQLEAEKARIAALRANDMTAYTKMLEETRNDRLKFLLDKTDEAVNQISSLLHEERANDSEAPTAAAAASSALASQGTSSYYASAHVRSEEVKQPSILEFGSLKEYQLGGLKWMVSLYNNRLNGILADEMGLGKTVQTIALIAYLMESKDNRGPYLVIVPLSTLSNWVNEFKRWCPTAHVITYKGIPSVRKDIYRNEVKEGHFNVLLTTYEYIIKDKNSLRKIQWQYAIIDEGHRMKNTQSKFAQTLSKEYVTRNRLLLTGTPLQNNLSELWALLNFLLPTVFNSSDTFDAWFNAPFANYGNQAAAASSNADAPDGENNDLSNEERMLIIHRLHELLRPFMLRRVKSEVLDQLPEKVEKVVRCELSSWQKALYRQISKSVTGDGSGQPTSARGLNNVMMQLRKVCNHPFLFAPDGYFVNDDMVRTSGKFELLDRMLPKLKRGGHRVLMFTQMTQVMAILEDYFRLRGFTSLSLSGSTSSEERERRMDDFNAPNSEYFIFLLSTRAGGLGLNLATADTVIIFDSDWNPAMDAQAQDRAHRIGQKRTVSVFRLITNSPVEEKILSRATEKQNMNELVIEAGKFDKSSVEQDNSQERMKMMEILMTDFDDNINRAPTSTLSASMHSTTSSAANSDNEEEDTGEDDDGRNELNEILSTTEEDYQLYCKLDVEFGPGPGLNTDPNDIPDWIRYPHGKDAKPKEDLFGAPQIIEGKRSAAKKAIVYDDGLTEKQFARMMDKKIRAEEAEQKAEKARKRVGKGGKRKREDPADAVPTNPNALPQPIAKKLTTICKAIIALKDVETKRRLSDLFLEKPDRTVYPDYYTIIERPIGIHDIVKSVKKGQYSKTREFYNDWQVLVANALKFNGPDSWVTTDANKLGEELDRQLEKHNIELEEEEQAVPALASVPKPVSMSEVSAPVSDPIAAPSPPPVAENPDEQARVGLSVPPPPPPPAPQESTQELHPNSLPSKAEASSPEDESEEDGGETKKKPLKIKLSLKAMMALSKKKSQSSDDDEDSPAKKKARTDSVL